MSADVQELLDAARSLPPEKQLELLRALSQSLTQSTAPLATACADFRQPPTLDELSQRQGARPIQDLSALAMPDWPTNESADALIAFVRSQRESDRQQV